MVNKKKKNIINIKKVSKLSKLKLSKSEEDMFTKQLEKVVDYISELNEIDTSSIEPTSQTTGLSNVKREDKVKSSISQQDALSQNRFSHNGYFVVDMVLENKEI